MYRLREGRIEVFLAHPGGPIFARRDSGHWTIPKGEVEKGENLLETAIREFQEEVSVVPSGDYIELGWIQQKGGKIVYAWGFKGDHDDSQPIQSNSMKLEWPPSSGVTIEFPEVDRAQFFSLPEARRKIKETQTPFLDRLEKALSQPNSPQKS